MNYSVTELMEILKPYIIEYEESEKFLTLTSGGLGETAMMYFRTEKFQLVCIESSATHDRAVYLEFRKLPSRMAWEYEQLTDKQITDSIKRGDC